MKVSFRDQQQAWAHPPLDDIGYVASSQLLALDDDEFMELIQQATRNRYSGWRNIDNVWRDRLGIDRTHGERVLDYGCGAGFEALQYALNGNDVWVADIAPDNLKVAGRAFRLSALNLEGTIQIRGKRPYCDSPTVDVIHCSGVLHHIPYADRVVEEMTTFLAEEGELRLMVYSDIAWRDIIGGGLPTDMLSDPDALEFARAMDGVGTFADWYSPTRLEDRFGEWFELEDYAYIPPSNHYLIARLRKL